MNKLLISAALAGVLAAGASHAATGDEKAKEKCYGVAEAGKNDCASADGSHSCAGLAKTDKDGNEWKYVSKGECETMGGTLAAVTGEKNSCDGKSHEGKNSCKK